MKYSVLLLALLIFFLPMRSGSQLYAADDVCSVENSLIVGSALYGLNCLDETGWHTYAKQDSNLPISSLQDIALCPDNTLAILHPLGLTVFDGTSWSDLPKGDWFAPKAVSCAESGKLWVAHMRGVSHYDGSAWNNYDIDIFGEDSRIIGVEDIALGSDGSVWALTARSAALFNDGQWQVFENGNGFDADYWLRGIAVDSNDQPWLVHTSGILHFDGSNWQDIQQSSIQTIAVDSDNQIWTGSYTEGVSVFDGSVWQTYTPENSDLNSVKVKSLAIDGRGRVWVGTEWGLSVFDGESWQTFLMSNSGLVDNTIATLIVNGDGPDLPELQARTPGSVIGVIEYGRDTLPDIQIELCTESPGGIFRGATPCGDMPGSMLATTDATGNFIFSDVPIGRYNLAVETPDGWIHFIGANSTIEVLDGQVIDLADIDVSD